MGISFNGPYFVCAYLPYKGNIAIGIYILHMHVHFSTTIKMNAHNVCGANILYFRWFQKLVSLLAVRHLSSDSVVFYNGGDIYAIVCELMFAIKKLLQ